MRWLSRPLILGSAPDANILILDAPAASGGPCDDIALTFLRDPSATSRETPFAALVRDVAGQLAQQDDGARLLEAVIEGGITLRLADTGETMPSFDEKTATITVPSGGMTAAGISRSAYFRQDLLAHLIVGLRLSAQQAVLPAATLAPQAFFTLSRLRIADALVTLSHIAYDMKDKSPALWRHVLGGVHGDIALRYGQHRDLSPEASPTEAAALAFIAWFDDDARVNAHDHQTLDLLDAQNRGAGKIDLLTLPLMRRLCRVSGLTYVDQELAARLASGSFDQMTDTFNRAHLAQIVRESRLVQTNNVAFQDAALAALIFPDC